MKQTPTIADLLQEHTTLRVDSLDRIYLNGYVAALQTPGGLCVFLREQRDCPIPSPAMLGRITREFVAGVEAFAAAEGIGFVPFKRKERKDEVANRIRAKEPKRDAVVFIGVAQEKQMAFKARKDTRNGHVSFDYSRQDVFVKQYYFYLDDEDFGPMFIKIGTYFPFPVRVCINGHEWAKRQLEKRGIDFEALDNGFLSCAQPEELQRLCDTLGPEQIEALFAKWMRRLPWPLSPEDVDAGYAHQLSVWQMEFSRTDVFTRPLRGREFFESVIRENIDLGRPDRVQLIFPRRIQKNTPGLFRSRVITNGVTPSLHIEYKRSRIKQYFKENRALRTETTINDATDFGIGKRLRNLPAIIAIARHTNERILEVERLSEDCVLSDASVQRLTQPSVNSDGQRVPGLKLADPRVMSLLAALCLFLHLPEGFRNRQLRVHVETLMGLSPGEYTAARMSYDLRRLRLKGIISRRDGTTRYTLTPYGLRVSLFVTRLHARVLRPGFGSIDLLDATPVPHPLRTALTRVDDEVQRILDQAHIKPKRAVA